MREEKAGPSAADLYAEELQVLRSLPNREVAIAAAQLCCAKHAICAPTWLTQETAALLSATLKPEESGRRGRFRRSWQRHRRDRIDHARWDEVHIVREKQVELERAFTELSSIQNVDKERLRELGKMLAWAGNTLERAFDCASMLLQGTEAHGGPDAVKASYFRVETRCGQDALRYRVLDPDFYRGIEMTFRVAQVKKITPIYNRTLPIPPCHRSGGCRSAITKERDNGKKERGLALGHRGR